MPKKLIEINKFTGGVVSTPSATDTDEQSAKYSSNIDPQTADGRLQGIDKDKILTSSGFAKPGTGETYTNVKEMVSVPDKLLKTNINLVLAKSNNEDSINEISVVNNIYGDSVTENSLNPNTDLKSVNGEYNLVVDDDKVHIGMGGGPISPSKVVMRPLGNGLLGDSSDSIGVFDSALLPPNVTSFSGMFSEFMMFPIHGGDGNTATSPNNTFLSYDDTPSPAGKLKPDYDFELDVDPSGKTLYDAINTSGLTIEGIKVGQIFKTNGATDFSDGSMLAWKRYDYDISATIADNELYMFCGYISETEQVPILRYLGLTHTTDAAQKGTPSFAYAIKDDSSSIYKISLSDTRDAVAFTGASAGTVKDKNGAAQTITNVSNRIAEVDLSNIEEWEGDFISAFSACHSPPLFNSIGLAGELETDVHLPDISSLYYNNGHIKILYRHGIFYVASKNNSERLYRVNVIDFYNLTSIGPSIDDLTLDFTRIPDQLEAEDGKGIVRRTIEDNIRGDDDLNPEDPKNENWTNKPSTAYIVGICETFDCGQLSLIEDESDTGVSFTDQNAFRFTTLNQSRLTTGEKVRFAGLSNSVMTDIIGDTGSSDGQNLYNDANTEFDFTKESAAGTGGDAYNILSNSLFASSGSTATFLTKIDNSSIGGEIENQGAAYGLVQSGAITVVVGHTYQLDITNYINTISLTDLCDADVIIRAGTSAGGTQYADATSSVAIDSDGGTSVSFKAESTSLHITIGVNSTSSGHTTRIKTMKLTKVSDKNFNVAAPYEVSVIKDGRAFYVDSGRGDKVPVLDSDYSTPLWWNTRVWVLYAKITESNSFTKWDLFLYNANTLDMSVGRALYMADRTPPFHQARYYRTTQRGSSPDLAKLWYPAEFAFVKSDRTPGGENTSGPSEGLLIDDVSIARPGGDIQRTGDETSGNLCEFGIYDKSGRWACNGVNRVSNNTDSFSLNWPSGAGDDGDGYHTGTCGYYRPRDWVGGQDGPVSWKNCHDNSTSLNRHQTTYPINRNKKILEYTDDDDPDLVTGLHIAYMPPMGISGDMIWGQNIGWDMDNPREVFPIKNSLHPLVPYSSLYNGNLFYSGFNSVGLGSDVLPDDPDYPGSIESNTLNHNRPKHAVTFLGKVTGRFIVQPGDIRREGLGEHGATHRNDMDRAFEMGNHGWERIKSYNNDHVLFTIDDFSGHRGSVKYKNGDNCTDFSDIESHSTSYRFMSAGVETGRPNWGGPEIENPVYRATSQVITIDGEDHQNGSHSSVNGGLYDNDDLLSTDKGWDGYTPPYLFNPGSGYYVYINRTWKSMCDNDMGLTHTRGGFNDTGAWTPGNGYTVLGELYQARGDWTSPTRVWGFQTQGYNTNSDADINKGVYSQRWHNFSSTAISDNYARKGINVEGDFTGEDESNGPVGTVGGSFAHARTRFYSKGIADEAGDISNYQLGRIFSTMPSIAQAVCTMHKITVPNMGIINSIFPVIVHTSTLRTGTASASNEFFTAYLCGTNRTATSGAVSSGALLLRNNFDSLWHDAGLIHSKFGNDSDSASSYKHKFNQSWYNKLYTQHTRESNLTYNDEDDGLILAGPIPARGSHGAEIVNITDDDTDYRASSSNIDGLQIKGAGLDTYSNSLSGESLVLMAKTPWNGFTAGESLAAADFHWWFQIDGRDTPDLYFGESNESLTRTIGATYPEDANISFFSDDSGQLFSTDDIDLAEDADEVLTKLTGFLSFSTPIEGTEGPMVEGTYYYKLAFQYDSQYESPLSNVVVPKTLTPVEDNGTFDYINLTISFPTSIINSLSRRITGLSIYRKFGGGDADAYSLIGILLFDNDWMYNSSDATYSKSLRDKNVLLGDYSILNGIDQNLEDTSLNYGLSTVFQGYLFVSKAWHSRLDDIRRYIFRSQPDNFFAFDWTKDFVIMPEVPIAMVSFNSRLYVWGQNTLYKIDPYSMLIEDTYDGISILSKDSFVKTEFGLCFMDTNNVYIHDGNKPMAIADPILYSSNDSVVYESVASGTDGYIKLEQGYRELAKQTLTNGHKPHISYSGKKDSFLIHLSNSALQGKTFSYNIRKARWDFWDSPKPYAITSAKDSNVIISDGTNIWNYLELESDEWTDYNRREWDWFSKDINFNTDTQDKVFRNIKFAGTPSIYDYTDESVAVYGSDNKTASVQAYVDDELVALTVKNKFYETLNLGGAWLYGSIQITSTYVNVKTLIYPLSSSGGVSSQGIYGNQSFIRPGHLIKIDDEIMLVTASEIAVNESGTVLGWHTLTVERGQMGTTIIGHDVSTSRLIYIVSPILKFPAGTKGKTLSIRLAKQKGYIDSIGVVYKPKSIK